MQNQIQEFQNEAFGKIRVLQKEGQPWFVGKDVALALGYANTSKAVTTHVDAEDRVAEMIPTAQNGKLVSKTFIINESGLYSLILSSKLPAAKSFKRWVTMEVLPAIRKYGAYITPDTLAQMRDDSDFAEELLEHLSAERAKNSTLMGHIATLQPKAQYYDTILQSSKAIPISIIAKDYGMSAFAFNRLLHELGVQYRIGGTWLLYKAYANCGYTVSKTYLVDGKEISVHTCWTQRGRMFLYDILKWYGILLGAEQMVG